MGDNSDWLVDPKKYFQKFDADGNGKLDKEETKKALQSLGFSPTAKEMDEVFAKIDTDGSGFIEFENDEFDKLLGEINLDEPDVTDDKIRQVFEAIDENKDGHVTTEKFKKYLTKHTKLSQDQITQIVNNADEDGDGEVNIQEFISMYSQSAVRL